MQRTPVASSNLAAVGYDATAETLEIEFQSGAVYAYYRVPPAVYQALLRAASKGSYFNNEIRDAGYSYRRLVRRSRRGR